MTIQYPCFVTTGETSDNPTMGYDKDADELFVLLDDSGFYGKYINDFLTVLYKDDTNDVVGFIINKVSRILK